MENGFPVVERTGPKKVERPDMSKLRQDINTTVQHKQRRSYGAMVLLEQYREQVSRRDLMNLVELARREKQAERLQRMRRITWNTTGVVLSMDDVEYRRNPDGSRIFTHNQMDLASRFGFPPKASTGGVLAGEVIAKLLEERFKRHGAPLVLKRDNGSNLNHEAVDEVLDRFLVIPLNSPTYYPPYNGVMERENREIIRGLGKRLDKRTQLADWMLEDAAGLVVHVLNHDQRRVLSGRTACGIYSERKGGEYSLRQREQIIWLLEGMVDDILGSMSDKSRKTRVAAWRIAVEIWLQNQGHITVSMNGKVLPYSFSFLCHK
jgi:transposase InsO family protein